jgi:hypothetical protein
MIIKFKSTNIPYQVIEKYNNYIKIKNDLTEAFIPVRLLKLYIKQGSVEVIQ